MRTRSEEEDYEARVRESPPRRVLPPPPPPPPPPREDGPQPQPHQQQQNPPPPPPPPPPPQQQPQQQQVRRRRPEDQPPPPPPQQQQQPQEPPPPPAARRRATNVNDNDNDWILQVRLPPRQRSNYGQVRKIHITADMDVETLAACLQQGLNLPISNSSSIHGLFDSTEMFCSLQYILSNANNDRNKNDIYAVELEPPPALPEKQPWWHWFWSPDLFTYVVIPLTALFLVYHHQETVITAILSTITAFYNTVVEIPLQDLYVSGPWFVGAWEGEALPTICARITYHGDAAFWARNLSECQRIFDAKQTAWLRLARPLLYTLLFLATIGVGRLVWWEYSHHVRQQQRGPIDREMADLYRAFHTILAQVQRVVTMPAQQQPRHHRR